MWRFILVTFGFLGFAFWEMSGGGDYAPSDNSLQAQANRPDPAPTAETSDTRTATAEPEQIEIPARQKPERFQITLASIGEMAEAGATFKPRAEPA